MDTKTLNTIVTQIHRRFPEFSSVQPKVQRQNGTEGKAVPTYLLTFQCASRIHSGAQSKTLPRWVRVVVTETGKIVKITTSR
jgi:hypothetical protein